MNEVMSAADIAEYLGLCRRHVVARVTKAPGFPKPVVNLSRKTRRWDAEEVKAYVASPKSARQILENKHGTAG